ncbi:hypothetical protein ACFE04_022516 [Oxalis oulophora]
MLKCLSLESPSATSSLPPSSPLTVTDHTHLPHPHTGPSSQATSTDGTPRTSTQVSPSVHILGQFTAALETPSCKEIVSRIVEVHSSRHKRSYDENEQNEEVEEMCVDQIDEGLLLSQVLYPNRECVEEAILGSKQPKSATLKALVTRCFSHSERTARHLCHLLCQSIYQARRMYEPIQKLLEVLPFDDISQAQANCLYELFIQFDQFDNPFTCPENHNFQETRKSYSDLKLQLDKRLQKSQSAVKRCQQVKAGSAYCLIGATLGVIVSALVIVTHAVGAIAVVCPFCTSTYLCTYRKKELALMKQLDTASQGAYFFKNYLATTDSLVSRLYTTIEDDKWLIRLGLEKGRDLYPIQEVLKQLRKNQVDFRLQLKNLEEHIYICFNNINKYRSRLLNEIILVGTSFPSV